MYDPFSNPAKCAEETSEKSRFRATIQAKMDPRISGGTRVDMFNNEFRARLSLIVSPLPSSIRFSNALMDSMFISWPILDRTLCQRGRTPQNAMTHIDDRGSWLSATGDPPSWKQAKDDIERGWWGL